MLLEHWALNRSESQLDLCECCVSGVWIKKNVGEILCYLGNLYIYISFLRGKLCSLVLLSDIPCRQCEVTISSFPPLPPWDMWWVDTTHNDKMCLLLCFGIVFISLPQRNGVEESGVGHEMMQGTWLLPGSWQGAKTPCVVDIANMKVFSCGVQLYKCRDRGLLGQRGTGNWPSTCWAAEFKAWTSQSEKAARRVARDPSVDKEHGWEGDWQHLVGEGRFSRSLIYSRCSKVTYVWGFFSFFPHNTCSSQGQ